MSLLFPWILRGADMFVKKLIHPFIHNKSNTYLFLNRWVSLSTIHRYHSPCQKFQLLDRIFLLIFETYIHFKLI